MGLHDEVDLLRNIPLFSKISPSKLKLIAFTSTRVEFDADSYLFRQGEAGDCAYIILSGEARVLVDGPAGEILVATLGVNDFLGEIALLCDSPRSAHVKAKGSVVTLRIDRELFFQLITEVPLIGVELLREMAQRLERTTRKLGQVMGTTPVPGNQEE